MSEILGFLLGITFPVWASLGGIYLYMLYDGWLDDRQRRYEENFRDRQLRG